MPLFLKHTDPLRAVWRIEETSAELLSFFADPSPYLPFLDQLATEARRCEWLAARLLLKELLGREAAVEYTPDGAPYLADDARAISLSHTKGFAAALVSSSPVAGIDIEYRGDRILRTRRRFMSDAEERHLDPTRETDHLLIHWCAKEALFKMIRQTEVDFREHLHVRPFAIQDDGTLTVQETRTGQRAVYQLRYLVGERFILVYST